MAMVFVFSGPLPVAEVKLHLYLFQLISIVDGLDDDEPILDSILVHMGSMYSAMGKFEQSIAVYRRAILILESLYG